MQPKNLDRVWQEAELLYDSNQVAAAFARMAQAITERLAGRDPLCLCVMTGGIVATGQLLPRLVFPLQLDYIHATRYQGRTQGGGLVWVKKPDLPLAGRVVLVIDDILDEGLTMQAILDDCQAAGAAEVYSTVLADKQRPRAPGGLAQADFTGLHLPDRYVFGYGLDYHDYWRNAPGIYAVKEL